MADLDLGVASGFPDSLDTNPTPQVTTDPTNFLPLEGLKKAVIAMQTEMGVLPTAKTPLFFMQNNVAQSQAAVALAVAGTPQELNDSDTWDPGSLADGAGETKVIGVTGAALGDFVMVSAPYDLQDMTVTAYVQAADTVEIRLQNESGGVIDLASGTWNVRVIPSSPVATISEVCMPWTGSIVGISVFSNAARTAGTLTVDATINGTVIGLEAELSAAPTTYDTAVQARAIDVFSATDRIGAKITTAGGWTPTTADIVVAVFVNFGK